MTDSNALLQRSIRRLDVFAMFLYILITFALILQVSSDTDICNICVCGYNSKNAGDFQGEFVDCSYNVGLLNTNHTIPPTIHSLDLSSGNLSRIDPTTVLQSKTMVTLFLNSNLITVINPNALQLPELRRLDLSDNFLEHIDKAVFRNVKKLQYLNLANNRFTTFSKLTFHALSNLQEIVLDNNKIGRSLQEVNLFDRSGFGLTQKIKSLSISGINLNTVPDNFFVDAYDIRTLIISNNNITDVFELPFTLEYLDLSDNPILEIESEDFNDLLALKELKLNNIAIKEIGEYTFTSLKSLQHLELERNQNLTEFSPLAFGREVIDDADDFLLESFSLKNSGLWRLDSGLLVPFERLSRLDLQGNKWHCDCKLAWIKTLQIPEKDSEHLRCLTPKVLFNARIFSLNAKYFQCPLEKHYAGVAITGIALCSILAIISVWFFVFVPKYYSRDNVLREMYAPSTAYSVLPMTTTVRGIEDF